MGKIRPYGTRSVPLWDTSPGRKGKKGREEKKEKRERRELKLWLGLTSGVQEEIEVVMAKTEPPRRRTTVKPPTPEARALRPAEPFAEIAAEPTKPAAATARSEPARADGSRAVSYVAARSCRLARLPMAPTC